MANSIMNRGWTAALVPTALAASLIVIANSVAIHASAYTNAPRELGQLLEAMRDAAAETETYERDVVTCVSNMQDKVRLGSLLREIQKTNISLSSDLALLLQGGQQAEEETEEEKERHHALVGLPHIKNHILIPTMKLSARLFWLEHRADLHSRLHRLDTLKMRFLVVYMGAVASNAHTAANASVAAAAATTTAATTLVHYHQQQHHHHQYQHQHQLHNQPLTPPSTPKKDNHMLLMQSVAMAAAAAGEVPRLRSIHDISRPVNRRTCTEGPSVASTSRPQTPPQSPVTTLSEDLQDRYPGLTRSHCSVASFGGDPKTDVWSGVVAELQKSPKMEARREIIETAMRSE